MSYQPALDFTLMLPTSGMSISANAYKPLILDKNLPMPKYKYRLLFVTIIYTGDIITWGIILSGLPLQRVLLLFIPSMLYFCIFTLAMVMIGVAVANFTETGNDMLEGNVKESTFNLAESLTEQYRDVYGEV